MVPLAGKLAGEVIMGARLIFLHTVALGFWMSTCSPGPSAVGVVYQLVLVPRYHMNIRFLMVFVKYCVPPDRTTIK